MAFSPTGIAGAGLIGGIGVLLYINASTDVDATQREAVAERRCAAAQHDKQIAVSFGREERVAELTELIKSECSEFATQRVKTASSAAETESDAAELRKTYKNLME